MFDIKNFVCPLNKVILPLLPCYSGAFQKSYFPIFAVHELLGDIFKSFLMPFSMSEFFLRAPLGL